MTIKDIKARSAAATDDDHKYRVGPTTLGALAEFHRHAPQDIADLLAIGERMVGLLRHHDPDDWYAEVDDVLETWDADQ